MKIHHILFTAAIVMTAVSCNSKTHMGIRPENLDPSFTAGNDFYQYATGGWQKNNPLPDEFARFGSFDQLADNNQKQLKELIEEITSRNNRPGTNAQKIADLYHMVMDTTRRNAEGIAPLLPYLQRIEAITSREEFFSELISLEYDGLVRGFFSAGIEADEMDSKSNIVMIYQGGLTLGEKEYYLDTDEATASIRDAYKKHIAKMFALFGFDGKTSVKKMEGVMNVETRIAMKSRSGVELRNPVANYNKISFADLQKDYSRFDWKTYFAKMGMEDIDFVDVGQPEAIGEVEAVLTEVPVEELKAYLEWQLIDNAAGRLSSDIDLADFEFYGEVMQGLKEQKPLWKRATGVVNSVLGEAIGQLYVEKHFSPEAKARMEQLVRNLQAALGERIDEQEWMSRETKERAHEKLTTLIIKIGYPDKWTDYSKLNICAEKNYFENMIEVSHFVLAQEVEKKFKKPVDNTRWFMNPQTVNAYYNPTTNEICFPAGILQYPFFDMDADDAFNYGAIGVVIGHEMTHGYDDQGRMYDKEGNLNNWWAEGDDTRFNDRVKVLIDHFNGIEVLPGLFANGALSLGENIADHGGLMVSWQAYRNATRDCPLETVEGLTADQRFFLAYANVWAGNIRDEEIRNRTKSDVHSLSRWRVNGTLPHIDAWYEAFNVQPTDALYLAPDKRARIW